MLRRELVKFDRWAVKGWHLALVIVVAVAIGLILGLVGGTQLAKNNIGGSTTDQLTRCKPDDTTIGCQLQKQRHGTPGLPPPSTLTPPHASTSGTQDASYTVLTSSGGQRGIDFAWSCPDPTWNYGGAPVQFAESYLSPDGSKNWSRNCINWWLSKGKRVGLVWESSANRAEQGYSAGWDDAGQAMAQAAYLLPGSNVKIAYAIDCDCSFGQTAGYFDGARARMGGTSRLGDYGGFYPTRDLLSAGKVSWAWQAYAWSYSNWDSRAHLEQWLNGDAWDYDRTIGGNDGLYPAIGPPPKPPDPYAHYLKIRFGLAFGHKASEYNTVKTWDSAGCENPVRRTVCKTTILNLKLLRDRDGWVAHHRFVLKNGKWQWVASRVHWDNGLGRRFGGIEHRITMPTGQRCSLSRCG